MIVTMFVSKGVEAKDYVQNAQIQQWAVEVGLGDLSSHLVSAGELGWIEEGPITGTTKLTEAGFAAGRINANRT